MSEKEAVVQQLVQVLSLEGDSINTKVGRGLLYDVSSCIVHLYLYLDMVCCTKVVTIAHTEH